VPEVQDVFVDSLTEGANSGVVACLGYIFEAEASRADQTHFVSRFLAPLSDPASSQTLLSIVCTSVAKLLATWPGLFCLGFQINAIQDMLTVLLHRPDAVIRIFQVLLVLDCPAGSVSDSFSGFFFYTLLTNGVIGLLNGIARDSQTTAAYIYTLLPYVAHMGSNVDVSAHCAHSMNTASAADDAMDLVMEVSRSLVSVNFPTSILDFTLPEDETAWDWRVIQWFVGVVLPHNDRDAQSTAAVVFYGRLLDYYSRRFTSETVGIVTITDTLTKLMDLLVSRPWGWPIFIAAKP
jgi:hypothetical protein